ncbi:vWA domain-containing protein [Paracoccus aminophilus]|uniref:von Willebrand factor n=1 Tax=Paracoccus aminophilus JCM 7686 TaxID=1367847 RepID=S5YZR3_PARAH|nr:vWA domain-containing protein [Paracoccus aminophilus]AGT10701.1 von Willebrand factor [Paracoccus aminophilus JCM 7686]
MSRHLIRTALGLGLFLTPLAAFAEGQQTQKGERIEVAFVLDTTGSMVDLIEGAKQKIWSITNTMLDVNPDADIRLALVAYRDRGDDYVLRTHDMSGDVQDIYAKLRRFSADGGGDTPESVNEALDEAVRNLDWTKGEKVRRIIFLVGDAPPHMDYDNAPRYAEVIAQARKKGITLNTVQAGDDGETRQYWQEMARLGGGRYIAIPQDGGQIRQIPTPFDAEILKVQDKIDQTILPYGSQVEQAEVRAKVADRKTASAEVQADNSSFYSKKSVKKEAVTGGNDMVSAVVNGDVALDKIPEADLAPELQKIPAPERKAYLDGVIAERAKLEAEMDGLVQKRDAFIASESSKTAASDSFDSSVKELLKEQIATE